VAVLEPPPPVVIGAKESIYSPTSTKIRLRVEETPAKNEKWCATSIPPQMEGALLIPLESAPVIRVRKSDLFVNYFPNWEAVRSQWVFPPVIPTSLSLPTEGYKITVAGMTMKSLDRMVSNANRLRTLFARSRMFTVMYSEQNLSKLLHIQLGTEFGFNNIGKIKVCGDTIFILLTCATTPNLGIVMHLVGERLRNALEILRRLVGLGAYQIKVIAIHRRP